MKIIDSHVHLIDLQLGQYAWLKPDNPPFWPDKTIINNNFTESDLTLTGEYEVDCETKLAGFIHIEAGFNNSKPSAEIAWLESSVTLPFKAVACVDLTLSVNEFQHSVDSLLKYKSVSGVRHILDNEAFNILLLPQITEHFKYLATHKLSFDLQMPLDNLTAVEQLKTLLAQIPTLKVIINHSGLPPITHSAVGLEQSDWRQGLIMLSQLSQCAIKCSGWEMIDRNYHERWNEHDNWQCAVLNHCITTFGFERVMLASNFPLCLFHNNYQTTWGNTLEQLQHLALTEQKKQALVYDNACSWYKLTI